MPCVSSIQLTQFKNYQSGRFSFEERVIGICGLNGKGKTNLLDALYYCCFTKSYFSTTDAANAFFGMQGFRLEAEIDDQQIVCILRENGKKEILLNAVPYTRLAEHIGRFPAIMVAPDDVELITGSSTERRRYMDSLLSQLHPEYLQQLLQYNKVLQQRNSLLKSMAEIGQTDEALLEVLNLQLTEPGTLIYTQRKQLHEELLPLVQKHYSRLSNNTEQIELQYESQLSQSSFNELLQASFAKDRILQRTNSGIHKDDIGMLLNGQAFKITASQGQRKSLLFALKLAAFDLLKNYKGKPPLLFLDDVFEKLDVQRMDQLLQWVCRENTGQVFITDTHRERLEEALRKAGSSYQIIQLA